MMRGRKANPSVPHPDPAPAGRGGPPAGAVVTGPAPALAVTNENLVSLPSHHRHDSLIVEFAS